MGGMGKKWPLKKSTARRSSQPSAGAGARVVGMPRHACQDVQRGSRSCAFRVVHAHLAVEEEGHPAEQVAADAERRRDDAQRYQRVTAIPIFNGLRGARRVHTRI